MKNFEVTLTNFGLCTVMICAENELEAQEMAREILEKTDALHFEYDKNQVDIVAVNPAPDECDDPLFQPRLKPILGIVRSIRRNQNLSDEALAEMLDCAIQRIMSNP